MRLVKTNKAAWAKVFTCPECKAKLEVNERDLKVNDFALNIGGVPSDRQIYFECMICYSVVKVTDRVPEGIHDKLMTAFDARVRRAEDALEKRMKRK